MWESYRSKSVVSNLAGGSRSLFLACVNFDLHLSLERETRRKEETKKERIERKVRTVKEEKIGIKEKLEGKKGKKGKERKEGMEGKWKEVKKRKERKEWKGRTVEKSRIEVNDERKKTIKKDTCKEEKEKRTKERRTVEEDFVVFVMLYQIEIVTDKAKELVNHAFFAVFIEHQNAPYKRTHKYR